MDKSGQRQYQKLINKEFIIHSHKNIWREIIVGFLTFVVWIYCLLVVAFFLDTLFAINNEHLSLFKIIFKMNNNEIKSFLILSLVIFLIIYLVLRFWSLYNRKRYGKLTRRKYPKPTTKQDILDLKIIDEEIYDKLQKNQIIELDKNPISNPGDLYE